MSLCFLIYFDRYLKGHVEFPGTTFVPSRERSYRFAHTPLVAAEPGEFVPLLHHGILLTVGNGGGSPLAPRKSIEGKQTSCSAVARS